MHFLFFNPPHLLHIEVIVIADTPPPFILSQTQTYRVKWDDGVSSKVEEFDLQPHLEAGGTIESGINPSPAFHLLPH